MIYADVLKTNRMQLVSDLVAGKVAAASTGAASAGKLIIGDTSLSGGTGVLASIPLPTTPFVVSGASPSPVIITLQGVPLSVAASASGTAAKAELRNNSGTVIVSGLTVGLAGSGADIIVTDTLLNAGQTVTAASGVIRHG